MDNGSIHVSAPTVNEAIERGLVQLGLSRDQVQVQVLDEGSRGLLGLGARDAVVRLKPNQPAPQAPPEPPPEAAPTESLKPTPVSSLPAASQRQPPPRPQPQPEAEPEPEPDPVSDLGWSQEQIAEISRQTLTEMLTKMGIEANVKLRQQIEPDDEPPPIILDIEGDNTDDLVGRRGEVLNALQYVSRLIVSREVEQWVNLVVDVDHYKQRRAKSLRELAGRIADRVAQTQQPVALEPMPPNERRTIHIALRDHPSVTTQSVGKGDKRKVTIIPKR